MAQCNDFSESLENLVTCVICCEILTNPKTLPCLHTLCFKCIQDWNETCKNNRQRFTCPLCKASIKVPGEDVANFPTSFHHNSLIQLYNTYKNHKGNPQQLKDCSGCSNRRVVVGFCFQCQGMICEQCYDAHKMVNTLKDNHQATLWSEFTKASINSYVENKAFCKESFHEKFQLEYFCKNCKISICQKCSSTSHGTHDKISIEEAAHVASERLLSEQSRIDRVVKMRNKEIQFFRENKQRLQDKVSEEIEKVNIDFGAIIKILQDKQVEIITELNDKLDKKIKENDEKENTIHAALEEAVKLRDQCETMTNMNLKHFILEGYENLEEVCKATVKDEPFLSTAPAQAFLKFIPNTKVAQVLKDLEFGEVEERVTDPSRCSIECVQPTRCGFINQFSIATRDSKGDQCCTSIALIDVNIQDTDGNTVPKEIAKSENSQFTVKYRVEKPSPYNVVVSVAGKPIKNSPQRIKSIDAKVKFKPVRFFETTMAVHPVALDMNGKGEIAVVDNREYECGIVLYSADGEYLRRFGGEGTEESRLRNPFGVVFTNDDHILVSDNTDKDASIKEYHIDGRLLRTVYQQKRVSFRRMCTSGQNIACLSYNEQRKETSIMLFSRETCDHLQDVTLHAPKTKPLFLAYDSNKYFATFHDVHKTVVFDDNGGLLYTFGNRGNRDGQFNHPWGLAVFVANEMLLVCDEFNNRVQLFHQNGDFIRSFGTCGSGLGQMNGPMDVAVTPDGQVLVLEFFGERIHVFK